MTHWLPRRERRTRAPRRIATTLVLTMLGASPAALADGLQIGATPPPLEIATWVNGDPVSLTGPGANGRIVVLDFWTTWCSPCLLATPKRSQLAVRLADEGVRFVAVTDEPPADVREVLGAYPGDLEVSIGCDREGRTFAAYLGADGITTIPYTVVIDRQGRVAWKGDPRESLDQVLGLLVIDRYDATGAARAADESRRIQALLAGLANAVSDGDCARVAEAATPLLEIEGGVDDRGTYALALNDASWHLLTDDSCGKAWSAAALDLAHRAVEMSDWRDAAILDTCALALQETGDPEGALAYQRLAVDLMRGTPEEADYTQRLEQYRRAVGADDVIPDTSRDEGANPAEETALPIAPRQYATLLTREEAVADFRGAHEQLQLRYCGYDDLAWKLLCAGSSWDRRKQEYLRRLETRAEWSVEEYFALLRDYLDIVEDAHFWMRGPERDGVHQPAQVSLVTRHRPFVSDLRIRETGEGHVIVGTDEPHAALLGAEVVGVPVVELDALRHDQPFLLPTIPTSPDAREFLLGEFGDATPIESLQVDVRQRGRTSSVDLPLHRLRINSGGWESFAPDEPLWKLVEDGESPLPTIRIRTTISQYLDGYVDTAAPLREREAVMMDLRANGGGSDWPVIQWCSAFSEQPYRWKPAAVLGRGVPSGPARWTCYLRTQLSSVYSGHNPDGRLYQGRLFVVMDEHVGSGGESFVSMVGQINGAVLVGENTMGCSSYGNVAVQEPLTHSGITLRFGWAKFHMRDVLPIREGKGFMPEYWLDDEDPVRAIEALLHSNR